jgi:2-dehydropantoate 2-reductase
MKILIAGIGGVGGYFGGMLAHHFQNDNNVQINFLARGTHLEKIKQDGIKIITPHSEIIAKPYLATDNADEIGEMDYIIICTKNYDVEKTLLQIKPCVKSSTAILTLLNGVESFDIINKFYPNNLIINGCTYIVSKIKDAGVIDNSGMVQKIFFGLNNQVNDTLIKLESIFKQAGIDAILTHNISTIAWEKFIFISATATATSYFNQSIGEILLNETHTNFVKKLISEVCLVANAKGIKTDENVAQNSFNRFASMSFETTSSLHLDFKNNKPNNELESLTGYVIKQGEKYTIQTPNFITAYQKLK